MAEYLYYLLTVIGIGYFITQSDLVKSFRMGVSEFNKKNKDKKFKLNWPIDKFDGVINCIYCCSFWVGLAVYVGINREFELDTIFNAFSVLGTIYVVKNIAS